MKRPSLLGIWLLAGAFSGWLAAKEWWERKPFTDWTEKEAARMLDNSPWGKIHTVVISNPTYTGTKNFASIGTGDLEREKQNRFHLHFLTARPVRMAIARKILLAGRGKVAVTDLQKFVDFADNRSIVVGLTLSGDPAGSSSINGYNSSLLKLTTPDLVANTFLVTDTGRKVFLNRYDPPGNDGLGAKYYFPRKLQSGEPLVTAADREIRFETMVALVEGVSMTGDTLGTENTRQDRIWMQFDIRSMVFDGKLEI